MGSALLPHLGIANGNEMVDSQRFARGYGARWHPSAVWSPTWARRAGGPTPWPLRPSDRRGMAGFAAGLEPKGIVPWGERV